VGTLLSSLPSRVQSLPDIMALYTMQTSLGVSASKVSLAPGSQAGPYSGADQEPKSSPAALLVGHAAHWPGKEYNTRAKAQVVMPGFQGHHNP
jgi:hypothetical protein